MTGVADAVLAYVGLGANLGDPAQAVRQALAGLDRLPGCRLLRASRLYRSAPVDAGGPAFVNAVAELSCTLGSRSLLAALQCLEQAAGRQRPYRNAPRTLDLDLLAYGSERIDSPDLQLPHPRAGQRAFVLVPLAELAPTLAAQLADPAWAEARAAQLLEPLA